MSNLGQPKFSISMTGIRNGEYIIGSDGASQSKGVIIQVRFPEGQFYQPQREFINQNDVRYRDLLNWGFFANMSVSDRISWLMTNSIDREIYLSECTCELRFDKIDSDFTTKLTLDNQQLLMSGQWIPISTVYNMFPRKSTSRAARHTLIFRPSNWTLYNPNREITYSSYFSMTNLRYTNVPENANVYRTSIDFNGTRTYIGITDDEPLTDYSSYINQEIKASIGWFTPSIHKSLIQKCIRVRPVNVRISNVLYPTEEVLKTSFIMLLTHPGAFVPNIKRFVTGSESAFKRLAISLVEDSSCSYQCFLFLLFAALGARNTYRPSKKFVDMCISNMILGLNDSYFVYDNHNIRGLQLPQEANMIISMIQTLGSFESDIKMIVSIFENSMSIMQSSLLRPDVMEIYHCLDHHSITEIAHFYQGSELEASQIFKKIWNDGTGINSRKREFSVDPYIANAQCLLWIAKMPIEKVEIPVSSQFFIGKRNLDKSWIAGLIGPMTTNISIMSNIETYNPCNPSIPKIENIVDFINVVSFFDPDDLNNILTIQNPTRDSKLLVTQDVKQKAAKTIETKMSSEMTEIKSDFLGMHIQVKYTLGDFICDDLSGTLQYEDFISDTLTSNFQNLNINNTGNIRHQEVNNVKYMQNFTWSQYCKSNFRLPLITEKYTGTSFNDDLQFAVTKKSSGIQRNSIKKLSKIIDSMDTQVLFRFVMYIKNISNTIELNKLSRDGTGTYLQSHWADGIIFKILIHICTIIPCVLEFDNLKFKIKYFPFWNIFRRMMIDKITNFKYDRWVIRDYNTGQMVDFQFRDTRTLKIYQTEAVDKLVKRINRGKRANLLWLDVGMGKTLISLKVIDEMIKRQKMPTYVIFILTPSSISNIQQQIALAGFPFNHLIGTKENHNSTIYPNCINVVYHDHIRLIEDKLLHVAPQSFIIFDEVHLMFEDSKRTSTALQLSKLSSMFLGMTGTLIKNKSIENSNMIDWVSQVVEFEVTVKNYMIGIATLISGKTELPIEKIYKEVEVEIEDKSYYDYVEPTYGGKAEFTDFHKASTMCFNSVFNGIISRVLFYIQGGEKCVFVVAKNIDWQQRMYDILTRQGMKCFKIENKNSIQLTAETNERDKYQVVITTVRNSTGYDVTAARVMITAPYFTDEPTRQQLEGRIHRISQKSPQVLYEKVHCGILTYVMNNHNLAKIISKSIRELQKEYSD